MFTINRFLLLAIMLSSNISLLSQNLSNFNHLSPVLNNKIVNVYQTTQDALGNIWMLSNNGILKYDGYDYKLIKHKDIFTKWKTTDHIKSILSDKEKNIWLISESGLLSKYNSLHGVFEDISSLTNEPIQRITVNNDNIWLLTKNSILYRYSNSEINKIAGVFNNDVPVKKVIDMAFTSPYDCFLSTEAGKVYHYALNSKKITEIVGSFTDFPGGLILTADKSNKLWIGTETFGLFVYDVLKKEFVQDTFFSNKKFNVNKEMFLSLFCDSNGYIWGGTDGGGLYKINSNDGEIDLFTKNESNEFSLGSNTILNISEDYHKNIWVSTNYGKLNVLPFKNNNIGYHEGSANNAPQRILSIYKSSKNVLWLGTDGSGLTKVTMNSNNEIVNESQYFNDLALNKGFYVHSIAEDSQANIWFGTYKNGLFFHNTINNTFKKIDIVNSKNQIGTDVRTVFKDSKNRIWVGSNVAINVYTSTLKLIASFDNNSHNLEGSIMQSIIEDLNGEIWIGMYESTLFKLNENPNNLQSSTFSKQPNYIENTKTSANCIALGKSNELFLIGDNKLLKYNTLKKKYSALTHIEPLDTSSLSSLIVYNNDIWISSDNGITNINIDTGKSKTYYSTDGLQDDTFLSRSYFKDTQGFLYFGSSKGVNYFKPESLLKKESNAKLYINEIEILNQPIDSLIPSQSSFQTHKVENLHLEYNQSSFSFRFSAVDNILNSKYNYAYRLKGFDKDWITNHSERIATYTNIPPGDYTFEVKASTKKNIWNIPVKQINVSIEQPLWNKPIAYIFYFCILLLIIYGIRRWYLLKKSLLLEKISHKKESELHELKMNFFAKMSHEIQTPITLILGPIQNMLERAEQNGNLLLKQRLNIISNNAKRLSKIARELTLVRDKEFNTLKLLVTKNKLCSNVEDISISFKELARRKQIDFAINCPKNLTEIWYDKEKLEHVIYNLLSNAFKFTPKNGYIHLNIVPTNSKKTIKISITDSGPGIADEELNAIFELFYQSNDGKKNKGSGIGLALTKEIIDLHKGKIQVDSILNEGTTFTITIPIDEASYTDSERITTGPSATIETQNNSLKDEAANNRELNPNKKTILIVEDNYELQAFLKELLISLYNIIVAENGEEGYYYAKSNFPDLILSDIMMPKLDGIEMCKMLLEDNLTKHIPIVLLTAKNSTNSKIEGLKSGAIEYINKPFNTNELLLKIKNIIKSKEHIISKYRKEAISRPEVLLEKSQDEIFLENLVSQINLKLGNSNFKMEELAVSLNMSYSTLYRKCQSLTGNSLVDFVRLLRLKKAAILITKYGYNISETSFKTGFNDPKYFSKCFKKQFKMTPGDFIKKSKEMNIDDYLKKYSIDNMNLEKSLLN